MGIWHDKLKQSGQKLLIISGGQRGSDAGGLAAAYDCGLPTGGTAPKGWLTLNGPNPTLSKLNLIEHSSSKYAPRTYENCKLSDGTIRLAYDFGTPGELCTLKAIEFYNKPHFDIDLKDPTFIFDVTDWIDKNKIVILNVAGNAGKTKEEGTRIFQEVRQYLGCIFRVYSTKCDNKKSIITSDCSIIKQDNSFVNSMVIGAVSNNGILGGMMGGNMAGGIVGDMLRPGGLF